MKFIFMSVYPKNHKCEVENELWMVPLTGDGETVETFFSLWMWHHAGRPTTDHCAKTIGINCYSPRETDNYTQTLDK